MRSHRRRITKDASGKIVRITHKGHSLTPAPQRTPHYSWLPWRAARQKACTHKDHLSGRCPACSLRSTWVF